MPRVHSSKREEDLQAGPAPPTHWALPKADEDAAANALDWLDILEHSGSKVYSAGEKRLMVKRVLRYYTEKKDAEEALNVLQNALRVLVRQMLPTIGDDTEEKSDAQHLSSLVKAVLVNLAQSQLR